MWLAAYDDADRFNGAASRLIRTGPVAALDLTLYEVANVAVARWRSLDAARDLVGLVAEAVGQQLIRIDRELVDRAAELAHDERLSVYDAAYVAAARRASWPLVSCDIGDLVGPGHAMTPDVALAADG